MKASDLVLLLKEDNRRELEGIVTKVKKYRKDNSMVISIKTKEGNEDLGISLDYYPSFIKTKVGDRIIVTKVKDALGSEYPTYIELKPSTEFMPKKFKPLNKKIDLE